MCSVHVTFGYTIDYHGNSLLYVSLCTVAHLWIFLYSKCRVKTVLKILIKWWRCITEKIKVIFSTVNPRSPRAHCHHHCHSTELLAQATVPSFFANPVPSILSAYSPALRHVTLWLIPSSWSFSSLGFSNTLLGFLCLYLLLLHHLLSQTLTWQCFMVRCPGSSFTL